MASGGGDTSYGDPKVDVPKPSSFEGKHDTRAVDDFLWQMEQYFKEVNIVDDTIKIKSTT